MSLIDKIGDEFALASKEDKDSAVNALRVKAFEAFSKLGIPSMRHEEWKYTNIKTALPETLSVLNTEQAQKVSYDSFKSLDAIKLVFVNGSFDMPPCKIPAIAARERASAYTADRRTLPIAIVDSARWQGDTAILQRQTQEARPGCLGNCVSTPCGQRNCESQKSGELARDPKCDERTPQISSRLLSVLIIT